MQEPSLIYMTKLYDEAMDLNTKLQEEIENLKNTNEEHRVLNGELREENKRLNNIIKKAIEFIYENAYDVERENCIDDLWGEIPKLLEILKGE